MEGNDENNDLNGQVDANAGSAGAENNQEQQTVEVPAWQQEAIAAAKAAGREVNTFEELLKAVEIEKPVEVVKEVNPYEGFFDEEDQAYFNFKKETGRSRKEFEYLKIDVDKLDPIEIAREQARRDIGVSDLSPELADRHISETLGIDLEEMEEYDKIKLLAYGKTVREEKKSDQEKYRQPAQDNTVKPQTSAQDEYVQLPGGVVMRKADHQAAVENQQKTVQEALAAVKGVESTTFTFSIDSNGTAKDIDVTYEYGEDGRRVMESIVSDLQGTISKRYGSEKGFNHAAFGEDVAWMDPDFRKKAISDIVSKSNAAAIEETLKYVGNHNLSPHLQLDKPHKEGVKMVDAREAFGLKH
jgi:hypothetical protein